MTASIYTTVMQITIHYDSVYIVTNMDISWGYLAGFFTRQGEKRSLASPASLGERAEEASWMRKAVVCTSVKALIWPFTASTLRPKQSDKVVGPLLLTGSLC